MKGDHVDVNTAARYCAQTGLGSVSHCRRWLVNEFEAQRRVVINNMSLAGYRDEKGNWWVRTARLIKVLGLTRDQQGVLRGSAEARRGPRFAPNTKRIKRGECVTCAGPCGQRVLIELDADLSWDGQPNPALVAELSYHRTAGRAMSVRVRRR